MEIKDRVLIVEDDKNIRKFIQTILEANDYDVIATETGKEAYSLITSRCPDVVILDLGLPDMDGMKILKEVRAWSNMPIIVVSARDHEKDKVEALDMGADDYITKPFGTSELLARIRAAIRHFRGTSRHPGPRRHNRALQPEPARAFPRALAGCCLLRMRSMRGYSARSWWRPSGRAR